MFIPDPALTKTIIDSIGGLFKTLRERVKNKDFFDIVQQLQAEQSKLETRMKEAETEVTRLNDQESALKKAHAAEIASLNEAHAQEIARLKKPPPPTYGTGFSEIGGVM